VPNQQLTSDLAPPPAILDIEASGFGLGSYPIEVGFVTSQGRAWCSLIRPEPDWQHWDPNAAVVHGITREQLQQHGRSSVQVAEALNEQLRGVTVYTDAWAHDFSWLSRIYEVADRSPSFKLENLRALLNEDQAARWHEVKLALARESTARRHRASADARLLQQTFLALQAPRAVHA